MNSNRRFTSKLALLALIALAGSVALPAVAGAQGLEPTQGQYDGTLGQLEGGADDPGDPGDPGDPRDPSALDENVGPLPFTGFDVVAMAAVALAIAGLGLALRHAVTRSTP